MLLSVLLIHAGVNGDIRLVVDKEKRERLVKAQLFFAVQGDLLIVPVRLDHAARLCLGEYTAVRNSDGGRQLIEIVKLYPVGDIHVFPVSVVRKHGVQTAAFKS